MKDPNKRLKKNKKNTEIFKNKMQMNFNKKKYYTLILIEKNIKPNNKKT